MKPASDNLIQLFNNLFNLPTSISTGHNTNFILNAPNRSFGNRDFARISDCKTQELTVARSINGIFGLIDLKS